MNESEKDYEELAESIGEEYDTIDLANLQIIPLLNQRSKKE